MLTQQTTLYEVIARWTDEGLVSCQKVETIQVVDDATTPPTPVGAATSSVTDITREEVLAIITSVTLALPSPVEDA